MRIIFLSDFTESFAYQLLKGILAYSKETQPWAVCKMPQEYKLKYGINGIINWAKHWQADAIIGQFSDHDPVELFAEHQIVAVAQDYMSRFTSIPNITSDYYLTGQMAAEFFINKGFSNFAFYGFNNTVWSKERLQGFQTTILQKGFTNFYEYQHEDIQDLWYYDSVSLASWLKSLPKTTALFACDDNQGKKITEVCRINGIKIPDDIIVLGVDNDEMTCTLSDPPLSSIQLNISKAGYDLARALDLQINQQIPIIKDICITPVSIINRASTDILSIDSPHILTAIRYIQNNVSKKLSVDEIVKQVPLSRRLLEIKFKATVNKTIYEYILFSKIECMANLLINTGDSVIDITAKVGLGDTKNVARIFKSVKGCTPTDFRKKHCQKF